MKYLLLATIFFLHSTFACAITTTFFTDRATFDAVSSTTLIDFEGIVADNSRQSSTSSKNVSGVNFSVTSGTMYVAGKNASVAGAPYRSAILVSNNAAPIHADLTSAGSGFTAVGGFFGNIQASGNSATLRLIGTSGILDTQNISVNDLAQSQDSFFGWTVSGDSIIRVEYDMSGSFEGIDDFAFGTTSASSAIPEPSSLMLLVAGMVSLFLFSKRS